MFSTPIHLLGLSFYNNAASLGLAARVASDVAPFYSVSVRDFNDLIIIMGSCNFLCPFSRFKEECSVSPLLLVLVALGIPFSETHIAKKLRALKKLI